MAKSKDVAEKNVAILTTDELQNAVTWDDYTKLLNSQGVELILAHETLGDGFAVVKDKNIFLGKPLMFLEWRFNEGDQGEFVSARVIVQEQNGIARYILNDGSTGIYQQLKELSESRNVFGGLAVRNGLRKSDYTYDDVDEKTGEVKQKPATTYYIDTSA